ncbi:sensor histidine kinase [Capillimicrobium parvum]|uniref:histidine kinase n=1 Tax=Capillimicrobium parvum TaxID=2884022 RepID=A0A9E7C0R1_9ACTN|nr:HAMP domain-containing sensor histidine kinase [Capillimicrobium parvum]UGS36690.1 Adaptive-response sensory-kinase SasA [Capillimicrobium parvum]
MLERIPIRWRLAGTSAALIFVILCTFAVVVGELTQSRIRSDFQHDVAAGADDLRDRITIRIEGGHLIRPSQKTLDLYAGGDSATIRLLTPDGRLVRTTSGAPNLGPSVDRTQEVNGYRVETRPVQLEPFGTMLVQYARPVSDMEKTLERVRLFLLFGVLGGTALALLAGLTIAQRAMSPIASLTARAEEIRRTRDPGRSVPVPQADDEISELARTLDRMLRALDAAQHETEASLVRQREFVADASHELRTPLTSVLANLELLADTLDGEQGEAAQSALRSSRRMRRLVADLLLLARADVGRETPRHPLDLGRTVIEAASELEPVTGDHELHVDVEPVTVLGARDDLHRVALNLMENAIRHTPAGTRVQVSVRRDGGDAVLVVSDDGPGIPEALRERVFERFVRGGGEVSGSSGLGLSIVRAVAEGHGGSVTLAAGAGDRGTRFEVRIPASQQAPAERPARTLVSS